MRSTLFYIPHEVFGVPLLGMGWLLGLLVLGCVSWMIWLGRQGKWSQEVFSSLPVWILAGALVVFVLPAVESRWPDGTPIGLPIRGYGVMVLLGLLSGIGLTVWRGRALGIPADRIISLGFWMMVGGVLGARAFFVFQYWDEFSHYHPLQRIISIVKLTEGGLVIYGGMIGGAIAGAVFCIRHRLPTLAYADLITPGFLIGLAFGRIGCLLNGCCFGGICTANLPAIQFPQGSPPYIAQLDSGRLLGLTLQPSDRGPATIESVSEGSIGQQQLHAQRGMTFKESITLLAPASTDRDPARAPDVAVSIQLDQQPILLSPEELPRWSLPVHPSQIYSALDALLLCLLVVCLQPWVPRDGQAFLCAVLLHSIARFTLELIRSDEAGQFGTSLTIAQWISIIAGLLALVGLAITSRLPAKRVWAWPIP